ncbi:5'-nucleotidase C-terminal domain-containing protein [Fluviibacterium sp. DFM31]|uniref:5'-nucleotidase C-terminal domain-containing protein n=1 Tax=Meridianimarinicoccus marinus TaxID=3231483 RepID=A0ABV3L3R2_9RHOB
MRILCTTDLHAAIWPFNYATDRQDDTRGLALLAPLIHAARREAANSCLFDVGDSLQGTALADAAAGDLSSPHPVIAAMNNLDYDAATLGNHDFDYGLEALSAAMTAARFPFALANLRNAPGSSPALPPPFVLLDREVTDRAGRRHPLRLGVLGLAPPQTILWNAAALDGAVTAEEAAGVAEALIPQMRAAGADLIVALCHSGIGRDTDTDPPDMFAQKIARLEGIDALLTGHSHGCLPGPDYTGHPAVDAEKGAICGTPALMAGAHGRHVGVLDLDLARGSRGWTVTGAQAGLRGIPASPPPADPAILQATAQHHARTRASLRDIIATAAVPLHTVAAMVGHAPALRVLSDAQVRTAHHMLRDHSLGDLPLLSAVAPIRMGGRAGPSAFVDLPEGPIRERDLLDLAPFPNRLSVFEITGAQLRLWLERAAACYRQVSPGPEPQPLLVPGAPGYNLDTVFGVTYEIDLQAPAWFDAISGVAKARRGRGRIRRLALNGQTVTDADRFAMVTSAFRACGGGGYRAPADPEGQLFSTDTLRQCLSAHARDLRTLNPPGDTPWRFAPMAASVQLQTSPAATPAHFGPLERSVQDLGLDAQGFRLLRLSLDG